MLRTLLILPDGREVFSGSPGAAVVSARLTRNVNPAVNIQPGGLCPDLLECTLAEAEECNLQPGQELTVYHVDDANNRHEQGIFVVQTARNTPKGLALTARDRLILLEQDLSALLAQQTFWPCNIEDFIQRVCNACGLEADTTNLPDKQILLEGCAVKTATGTRLMQWIAQLSGCFCRADTRGRLTFAWFQPTDLWLSVTGAGVTVCNGAMRTLDPVSAERVDTKLVFIGMEASAQDTAIVLSGPRDYPAVYRLRDCLETESFTAVSPGQVQLKLGATDPGACYPAEGTDAYIVQDNPLLEGIAFPQRQALAELLYERLQLESYTPCALRVPADPRIRIGAVIRQQTGDGQSAAFYVMQQIVEGGQMELRCTGAKNRSVPTGQTGTYGELESRITELAVDLSGIRARHEEESGSLSLLELELGNIRSRVSAQQQTSEGLQQQMTRLQQQEDNLSLQIRSVQQEGANRVVTTTGYRFDEEGLHIKKSGQAMENRLDYTGMYVKRSGTPVLTANNEGVTAVGVTVKDYLYVGDFSRFEDYSTADDGCRTACFYIGG